MQRQLCTHKYSVSPRGKKKTTHNRECGVSFFSLSAIIELFQRYWIQGGVTANAGSRCCGAALWLISEAKLQNTGLKHKSLLSHPGRTALFHGRVPLMLPNSQQMTLRLFHSIVVGLIPSCRPRRSASRSLNPKRERTDVVEWSWWKWNLIRVVTTAVWCEWWLFNCLWGEMSRDSDSDSDLLEAAVKTQLETSACLLLAENDSVTC